MHSEKVRRGTEEHLLVAVKDSPRPPLVSVGVSQERLVFREHLASETKGGKVRAGHKKGREWGRELIVHHPPFSAVFLRLGPAFHKMFDKSLITS